MLSRKQKLRIRRVRRRVLEVLSLIVLAICTWVFLYALLELYMKG